VGISIGLLTVLVGSLGQQSIMPTCVVEPGRRAERIAGPVKHRERFDYTTPFGWYCATRTWPASRETRLARGVPHACWTDRRRWWVSAADRRRRLATFRATRAAFPALQIGAHNARGRSDAPGALRGGVDWIGNKHVGATARLLGTWVRPANAP
jgi:hypothetical protein